MATPQIKNKLESPELTANQPVQVRAKLNACLASDPSHIKRDDTGDHVKAIQDALGIIRQRRPELGLPSITDTPGEFKASTAEAVKRYKDKNAIIRPGQPLDDVVGRMTITQIDNDLLRPVKPNPDPPKPLPPMLGAAGVQIGPLGVGARGRFVNEYYINCGLETIGPGQIATVGLRTYTTFEGLVDVLLTRTEVHQVIVNHGNSDNGLLVPCMKETGFSETGKVIGDLSGLADRMEKGTFDPRNPINKVLLDGAAKDMKVSSAVVLRIAAKLILLRKRSFIFHFRACNMKDPVLVEKYKKAFGARMITYHPSRLFFLRFILDQMNPGFSVASFPDNSSETARLRKFDDPIGLLSPMMLAIHDIDGHTRVEQESFIERRSPGQILGWAKFLLRQWRESSPGGFVVPIMWQNTKDIEEINGKKTHTFHCPLEDGWRKLLKFV